MTKSPTAKKAPRAPRADVGNRISAEAQPAAKQKQPRETKPPSLCDMPFWYFAPSDLLTAAGRLYPLEWFCLTKLLFWTWVQGGEPFELRFGTEHVHDDAKRIVNTIGGGLTTSKFWKAWPEIGGFFDPSDGFLRCRWLEECRRFAARRSGQADAPSEATLSPIAPLFAPPEPRRKRRKAGSSTGTADAPRTETPPSNDAENNDPQSAEAASESATPSAESAAENARDSRASAESYPYSYSPPTSEEEAGGERAARKRATAQRLPFPDDWRPSNDAINRAYAERKKAQLPEVAVEGVVAAKFREYVRSKALTSADHDAEFVKFVLNERPPATAGGSANGRESGAEMQRRRRAALARAIEEVPPDQQAVT